MKDIVVGEEIIDYVKDINKVIDQLQQAYDLLDGSEKNICENRNVYHGNATGEIKDFFQSQKSHLKKLINFYCKASQFALTYVREMRLTDEEIARLVINLIQ